MNDEKSSEDNPEIIIVENLLEDMFGVIGIDSGVFHSTAPVRDVDTDFLTLGYIAKFYGVFIAGIIGGAGRELGSKLMNTILKKKTPDDEFVELLKESKSKLDTSNENRRKLIDTAKSELIQVMMESGFSEQKANRYTVEFERKILLSIQSLPSRNGES